MISNFLSSCQNKFDIFSPEKEKFRVEIVDSINGLEKDWNRLFSSQYPLPVGNVLRATEESGLKDISFKYAVVFKGQEIFALLNFQLLQVSKKHYPDFSSISAAACNLYKIFSGRKYLGLIAGHLFITDFPSMACSQPNHQFAWLKEKVISRLAKQSDVDVVLLKDIPSEEEAFWQGQKKFSLLKDDLFMEMTIRPTWKTIDDYQNDLSKKYAARIQRMRNSDSFVQRKVFTSEEIEKYSEQIGHLYQQVVDKSSVKMGILNKDYFVNMNKSLQGNFEVHGYFVEGKLQAFATYISTGHRLELYYIGMNYHFKDHRELYPLIMLNGLEKAINGKFEQYRLGRTALEAKAILGCKPRNIINLVYFRNRWLRYMMNYLLKLAEMERGEQWKLRNPFREQMTSGKLKNELI